ncbi:MAG: lipoyl synthase [Candidatus Omnitrophica bacterium]|nr:lipoyl synthase [Candidatus Omnitrophota bacterium]
MTQHKRLPEWFRRSVSVYSAEKTHNILERHELNTVCESALCPNRNECYSHGTSTFMLLGNTCTRRCGFCAIPTGKPESVQEDEPARVASAAREMNLEYVVLTSVARDDLKDEGATHFARTVTALKEAIPGVQVEVLTPDFHAREELIQLIVTAHPTVYNHNLESVERFQKLIRPQASYQRSLEVLRTVKRLDASISTKSGLMLGLGETYQEIITAGRDLVATGCDILTLGQYLPPGKDFLPVQEYIHPDTFNQLAVELKELGFREVFAGPNVRSSYHAGETFLNSI